MVGKLNTSPLRYSLFLVGYSIFQRKSPLEREKENQLADFAEGCTVVDAGNPLDKDSLLKTPQCPGGHVSFIGRSLNQPSHHPKLSSRVSTYLLGPKLFYTRDLKFWFTSRSNIEILRV